MTVDKVETVRTFIAVEVPDNIKAAMKDVQSVLRKSGADVKWVRPEGVHLTLKFLGGVEAGLIDRLAEAVSLATGGMSAFPLEVKGAGVFPDRRRPRVVWLGLGGELGRLEALFAAVDGACEGLGFPREGRPFTAHLTLGRVRSPGGRESLMRAVDECDKLELGGFTVDSVSVMKSELKPSGAVYTRMRRIGLGG